TAGHEDQPAGVEGTDDVDRPRRDELVAERRAGAAEGIRLRSPDRVAAGHGSDPGRHRSDPGSTRWVEGTAGIGGDDRGRQVRRGDDARASVMPRLRVAVLAGGRSSEHEISLASARSVLESLDPAGYDVVTVAI